jgi:hypothetical protein
MVMNLLIESKILLPIYPYGQNQIEEVDAGVCYRIFLLGMCIFVLHAFWSLSAHEVTAFLPYYLATPCGLLLKDAFYMHSRMVANEAKKRRV